MDAWFLIRKSRPKIRGLVRFLHTIKSLLNLVFPNSNVQSTIPKGAKLLPVTDLTWMFVTNEFYLNAVFCNTFHSYNF